MKKSIVSIHNFNMKDDYHGGLKNVSFGLYEGEITSFIGPNGFGKETIVKILNGSLKCDFLYNYFSFDQERVSEYRYIKDRIHRFEEESAMSRSLKNWTVAEYIGMDKMGVFMFGSRVRKVSEEITELCMECDFEIDISRKLLSLNELELRKVELLKALYSGIRLLIIVDELKGLSAQEEKLYAAFMKRIVLKNMTIVFQCHNEGKLLIFCDRILLFDRNRIIAKWNLNKTNEKKDFANTLMKWKKKINNHVVRDPFIGEREAVFEVKKLTISGRNRNFKFYPGSVGSLLVYDYEQREKLFSILTGKQKDRQAEFYIDKKQLCNIYEHSLISKRIISAIFSDAYDELFKEMSIADNIMLPSLKKLSAGEMAFEYRRISYRIGEENDRILIDSEKKLSYLKPNQRLYVLMAKWRVYKAKIIFLYEPFRYYDASRINEIKEYIRQLAGNGTGVVVIQAEKSNLEDISNYEYVL